MRDTLTIGTIAGVLGTVVMHISSMIFEKLGLIKMTTLQVSSAIFLDWSQVNTPMGIVIGAVVHFIIGAGRGVLLLGILRDGKRFHMTLVPVS